MYSYDRPNMINVGWGKEGNIYRVPQLLRVLRWEDHLNP